MTHALSVYTRRIKHLHSINSIRSDPIPSHAISSSSTHLLLNILLESSLPVCLSFHFTTVNYNLVSISQRKLRAVPVPMTSSTSPCCCWWIPCARLELVSGLGVITIIIVRYGVSPINAANPLSHFIGPVPVK